MHIFICSASSSDSLDKRDALSLSSVHAVIVGR